MRSAVSRTAKGYSVEATLDIGGNLVAHEGTLGEFLPDATKLVNELSTFQIARLKEHMKALGEAFPRTEEE